MFIDNGSSAKWASAASLSATQEEIAAVVRAIEQMALEIDNDTNFMGRSYAEKMRSLLPVIGRQSLVEGDTIEKQNLRLQVKEMVKEELRALKNGLSAKDLVDLGFDMDKIDE